MLRPSHGAHTPPPPRSFAPCGRGSRHWHTETAVRAAVSRRRPNLASVAPKASSALPVPATVTGPPPPPRTGYELEAGLKVKDKTFCLQQPFC